MEAFHMHEETYGGKFFEKYIVRESGDYEDNLTVKVTFEKIYRYGVGGEDYILSIVSIDVDPFVNSTKFYKELDLDDVFFTELHQKSMKVLVNFVSFLIVDQKKNKKKFNEELYLRLYKNLKTLLIGE